MQEINSQESIKEIYFEMENPFREDSLWPTTKDYEHLTLGDTSLLPVPVPEVPSKPSHSNNLIKLIKQLIIEGQYDAVALLFNPEKSPRNVEILRTIACDVLHDVCMPHLNDQVYADNIHLFNCVENLLAILCAHGPGEVLLLEILELLEEQKHSDQLFISTLKALQVLLLRLMEQKPSALEWSCNSIISYIEKTPLPDYLCDGYDLKQQQLLEQDTDVQHLLMNYITIGLFYEPLLERVIQLSHVSRNFRVVGADARNVICCFLVQLLGKPLALLDLHKPTPTSIGAEQSGKAPANSYTLQCACNITKAISQCVVDPFYFLSFVEQRVRFKPKLDASRGVFEMSSNNVFLIEDKLPMLGLAIYYYMVIVEGVTIDRVPKVYAPLYVLESGIYLVTELLSQPDPPLHYRGLLLGKSLLRQLQDEIIPAVQLELTVHKTFCHALCNVVGYSSQQHIRQLGVAVLRSYILQFDDEGKYVILHNLLHCVQHTGISGYLAVTYKDLVANSLVLPNETPLPTFYTGDDFRSILLQHICKLSNGAETDFIEQSDRIISSLNTLRFFALNDLENRTGFWDFVDVIERDFLTPMRDGLHLSAAHYKAELLRIESGLDEADEAEERARLKLLNVNIRNMPSQEDFALDRKRKMEILNQNLCALDLMRSLLARATECIEKTPRKPARPK